MIRSGTHRVTREPGGFICEEIIARNQRAEIMRHNISVTQLKLTASYYSVSLNRSRDHTQDISIFMISFFGFLDVFEFGYGNFNQSCVCV